MRFCLVRKAHDDYILSEKCLKALILLELNSLQTGEQIVGILNLCRIMISQTLLIVYVSARNAYLKLLRPIHIQEFKLALGAFKTSLSKSLSGKKLYD